jgi:hypothetical protein
MSLRLTQDNLLTPDVATARAARFFLDVCSSYYFIDLNACPREYIRAMQPRMGVSRFDSWLLKHPSMSLCIGKRKPKCRAECNGEVKSGSDAVADVANVVTSRIR